MEKTGQAMEQKRELRNRPMYLGSEYKTDLYGKKG